MNKKGQQRNQSSNPITHGQNYQEPSQAQVNRLKNKQSNLFKNNDDHQFDEEQKYKRNQQYAAFEIDNYQKPPNFKKTDQTSEQLFGNYNENNNNQNILLKNKKNPMHDFIPNYQAKNPQMRQEQDQKKQDRNYSDLFGVKGQQQQFQQPSQNYQQSQQNNKQALVTDEDLRSKAKRNVKLPQKSSAAECFAYDDSYFNEQLRLPKNNNSNLPSIRQSPVLRQQKADPNTHNFKLTNLPEQLETQQLKDYCIDIGLPVRVLKNDVDTITNEVLTTGELQIVTPDQAEITKMIELFDRLGIDTQLVHSQSDQAPRRDQLSNQGQVEQRSQQQRTNLRKQPQEPHSMNDIMQQNIMSKQNQQGQQRQDLQYNRYY